MKKSYFDEEQLKRKIEHLKAYDNLTPWLAESLDLLGREIKVVPVEEDENRFIAEFIYPH